MHDEAHAAPAADEFASGQDVAPQPGPGGEASFGPAQVEYDGRLWPSNEPVEEDLPPFDEDMPHPHEPDWAPSPAEPGPAEALAFIDARLAELAQVDWDGWLAADPEAAQAAIAEAETLSAARADAAAAVDAEHARRLEQAHAELARDIEGWSPELQRELSAFGQARGFSADELAAIEDPREVKVLHLAMLGERLLAEQAHARRFGGFRPPVQLGGQGHPGHLPSDRQGTDAWMKARQAQLRKARR